MSEAGGRLEIGTEANDSKLNGQDRQEHGRKSERLRG